ncbi:MAG: hypothetical protein K0R87_1842 [Pseudonocardia sp.]|jgi:hypothetical protein|nr:hypothetical protein [Pseudonocardia sp.]
MRTRIVIARRAADGLWQEIHSTPGDLDSFAAWTSVCAEPYGLRPGDVVDLVLVDAVTGHRLDSRMITARPLPPGYTYDPGDVAEAQQILDEGRWSE